MKRLIVAVAVALSLVAGTGAALLAAPPSFQETCKDAEETSAGKKDFTCNYE
jgi:hypothetical protein